MIEPRCIFLYPLVIFLFLLTQLVVRLFSLDFCTKIICLWVEAKHGQFLILYKIVFLSSSSERIPMSYHGHLYVGYIGQSVLEYTLFKTLHLLATSTLRKQPNSYTENKNKDPKAHTNYCFQIHVTVCLLCVEFAVLMRLFNFPLLIQLCIKIPYYLRGNKELDREVLKLNKVIIWFPFVKHTLCQE